MKIAVDAMGGDHAPEVVVQGALQLGSPYARLYGDCLVSLIERQYLIQVYAHIEANSPLDCLLAASDGGAAATGIYGDTMFMTVVHDCLEILLAARTKNCVRDILNNPLTQAQSIDYSCAIRGAGAAVGIREEVFSADN